MTQADSARALRMSLDSEPSGAGQAIPESRRALCVLGGEETLDAVVIEYRATNSSGGWVKLACRPCAARYAGAAT